MSSWIQRPRKNKTVQFSPRVEFRTIENFKMQKKGQFVYPYAQWGVTRLKQPLTIPSQPTAHLTKAEQKQWILAQLQSQPLQVTNPLTQRNIKRFSPTYFKMLRTLWGETSSLYRQEKITQKQFMM